MTTPNTFIRNLAGELRKRILMDVAILAPSLRVGRQWLDRAALENGIVANAAVTTPRHLVYDLADRAAGQGAPPRAGEYHKLAALREVFAEAAERNAGQGYFTRLHQSLAVMETLLASFEDLEAAGVDNPELLAARLRPREKALELAAMFAAYRRKLSGRGFAGPAEGHKLALAAVAGGSALPFLIAPANMIEALRGRERSLWLAWPGESRTVVAIDDDEPGASLDCFAADGPGNEAREIYRRILAQGIAFDQVEIVNFAGAEGIACLCDAALELFAAPGGDVLPVESLPLTSADGLPGHYSRPGRLLAGWAAWLADGMQPEGLARLFADGLIGGKPADEGGSAGPAIAAMLRSASIPPGAGGYAAAIARAGDRDGDRVPAGKILRLFHDQVVWPLSDRDFTAGALAATHVLFRDWAAVRGEFDAYVRQRILEDPFLSGGAAPWTDFDLPEWLERLAAGLAAKGSAPLPGRVHLSGPAGGHSGRPLTFILGLDDQALPGGDAQDPVLLDRERSALSPGLALAAERRKTRERDFDLLLARLRGKAILSYSRLDLRTGAERFPAESLIRLARNNGKEEQLSMSASIAFAPPAMESATNRREFWLELLLRRHPGELMPEHLEPWFPNLARGEQAEQARATICFGVFDGLVAEAGGVPPGLNAAALAPSGLETFARCPQEYFFRYVLGVEAPERREPARGTWLDPSERGSLLHGLFRDFLAWLGEMDQRAAYALHADRLRDSLRTALADWERRKPPPDTLTHDREASLLEAACGIFLHSEEEYQKTAVPLYQELSFGGDADGARGEVELPLPSGRSVRLRGRMDRVDRLADGGLAVWDYKTGRAGKYRRDKPFGKGDQLQAGVYAAMLQTAMPTERIAEAGYFFPMPRDHGRRIAYSWEELRPVLARLDVLTGMMAKGVFPFTADASFESYDYAPVFDAMGGVKRLAAMTAKKAGADANAEFLGDWERLARQEE